MNSGVYRRLTGRSEHGLRKFMGELELAVMDIVWGSSPVTVRRVYEVLARDRALAYTTVMTVMGRLVEKGMLRREKQGRAYAYRATRSRPELRADLAAEVARALLADFGEVAVSQFLKELESVDPGAVARLAELAQQDESPIGE